MFWITLNNRVMGEILSVSITLTGSSIAYTVGSKKNLKKKTHLEISCKYSVYVTLWFKSLRWEAVMKPLNQGTLSLNLKPSWAGLNGFQLPISALAYSTTLRKWIQILLPCTQRATRWHAACLEMDVLRRSTGVIPVVYLKGKVGTVRSRS